MNDVRDLTLILQSRFPLVVIETPEEPRVLSLLENVCALEGLPLFVWSVADGLRRHEQTNHILTTQELVGCLRHLDATLQNGVYVLLDAHPFLEDPVILRLIREVAMDYEKTARTIVFVSNRLKLPTELARMSATFKLSVLDYEQVRAVVKEEINQWQRDNAKVRGDNKALDMLARQMVGLPPEDARRLIRQAISDDGNITMDDVRRVLKKKHDLHASSSVLSLELDVAGAADVAGQASLKRWLSNRRAVFLGALDGKADQPIGLDVPKGVLLLGVQGGGKSLAAKSVAGTWGLPLLRLDFGTLYNKFYGETEKNLREALAAAESMAPAVLWIDEIEKGIATDSSGDMDGGVSRRILGTLLTWMAERKSRVFLVATANDIEQLPPELMRKGRFDEIFFVDLPSAAVRKFIFQLHLGRRKHNPEVFDLNALAAAAEGFSGAEIEQAIVSALYEAHAREAKLDTALVLEEIARTKPLSVVMAEKVQALRDWARERTVPAD
jgi:SpoVK/Ycf46/Vps4 family AAA+-type ATPase